MPGWNFADAWETIASHDGDADALIHGDRIVSWAEFDRRADDLAAALLAGGVAEGSTVAQYLTNRPEYLEAVFAAFKIGLAPVNTNHRYVGDELVYLWDNADVAAVVFEGRFAERIAGIKDRVPGVGLWIWVDDGSGRCPAWALDLDALVGTAAGRTRAPWGRGPDSLYLLYTGGTTGAPKGVMWRHDDLLLALNEGAPRRFALPEQADLDALAAVLADPNRVRTLPASPLMHGTGSFNAFMALTVGGAVVTLTGDRFDAVELLDTIEARRVGSAAIVGDAFARPILAALDAEPDRWDLSCLRVLMSSGVMWSQPVKDAMLGHLPEVRLVDSLGSSEAVGMAKSVQSAVEPNSGTARFSPAPSTRVIADDLTFVEPGSDRVGKLAIEGRVPIGYYKDPVKSAETFVRIDGRSYSMPGDYARVDAAGDVVLLGRGSGCINTGGEKVFPEEVEEALKEHPVVVDAVVVGVPHERFGQSLAAVVEIDRGPFDEDDVAAHVRERLAAYKVPRRFVVVESIGRAANGKVDYRHWTGVATEAARASSSS